MDKKIDILKQILLMSTGEYYEVNLTKELVPGFMYQVIDGKKYNINEKLSLPENARFSDVIKAWGRTVPKNEHEAYYDFFDISNLISKFNKGQDHLCYRFNTVNTLLKPMIAEQHIFMYLDAESDCVMAFTYVLDLTKKVKQEEKSYALETKLSAERAYRDVLYRQYILAYHLNVEEETAEVLSLNQRSHVWRMPGMWQGAIFDFDKHIEEFEERFITSGNSLFREKLSRGYIAHRLKTTLRYSFRMECIPNVAGNSHYEVHVVRVNPDMFDGRVVIVSEEIDDTVITENLQQEQIDTERRYMEALTEDFIAVYHAKLKENVSWLIKVDTKVDGYNAERVSLRSVNVFSDRVATYADMYVVPEQRDAFKRIFEPENIYSELENAPRYIYRYQILQHNGKKKYFEVQIMRLHENEKNGDVLVAFRDIDVIVTREQRRQLELEAQFERERNQNEVLEALGNSFYTIFLIDINRDIYEIIRLTDEIKQFYKGLPSASSELSEHCKTFISPEHYEKIRSFSDLSTLNERMKGKASIEAECTTTDGNWRRFRFVEKKRDENGNLSQVLYVTQLISDEKNREERLISIAEAANEANAAKSEFISKVAHDIRTPMNSLFGFLQIAEANLGDSEKIKYSLQKIRVAGEFLRELVNAVLDISKMENGKLKLNLKEISVKELFRELPTSVEGADFGKKIEFDFNVHDLIADRVIADSLRLKQIYTNILSNAVKYSNEGGKVKFEVYEEFDEKVDDAAERKKVCLVVNVSDNGIGMSKEFMSKMFDKFERETDTRLNTVSGYGLGLSIVKQLVDLMNGEIKVESELGKGTEFTVRICLDCVDTAEDSAKVKKDYREKCRGMHLLIAEDNNLNREILEELLAMNDIKCDIVNDGAECVEALKKADGKIYDAVLMDIQMPKMNGVDAAKFIRASDIPGADTIPIIATTANAMSTDVQRYIDSGMDKHLSKPIDINKLYKILAHLK